jgi:hypothetical protein
MPSFVRTFVALDVRLPLQCSRALLVNCSKVSLGQFKSTRAKVARVRTGRLVLCVHG